MEFEFKLFIITATLALLLLIAVSGQQGCQNWSECYTDADCIKVQITCCPCEMSGTEICAPETLAPLYQEKLKSCPAENERVCMAQDNCKIKDCLCKKGRCFEKK